MGDAARARGHLSDSKVHRNKGLDRHQHVFSELAMLAVLPADRAQMQKVHPEDEAEDLEACEGGWGV